MAGLGSVKLFRGRNARRVAVVVSLLIAGPGASRPTASAATAPTITLARSTAIVGSDALADIACPTVSFCVAVGTDGAGHGLVVALHDRIPDPPQVINAVQRFSAVACNDAAHCLAIGNDPSSTLVAITNGIAGAPQPVAAASGIACPTTTLCDVVGGNTIVETVNGVATRTSTTNRFQALLGVSCFNRTACMVIGVNPLPVGPEIHTTAFAAMTNGVVGPVHAIFANQDVEFDHITCIAQPYCYAGGSLLGTEGDAVRLNASTANQSAVLEEFTLGSDMLENAACPIRERCVFAGGPALVMTGRPFDFAGGVTLPVPGQRIDALACPSASTCIGVGSETDPNNQFSPIGWIQPFTLQ